MKRRTLILVLAMLAVAACGPTQPSTAPNSPAVVEAQWGPLAVFRSPLAMEARNEGTIVITDRCTFLERGGQREFLAWPVDQTTWDPATASIDFRTRFGVTITVWNGDSVVLGGGGSSRGEDGLGGVEWASRLTWVAPPAPECLIDLRWEVSDVQLPAAGLPPEVTIECGPIADRALCLSAAEFAASVRLNPPPVVDVGIRLPIPGRDSCTAWATPCGELSVIVTIQSGDTLQDIPIVLTGGEWVVLEPAAGDRP
jgi:hypothetical protein